MQLALTLERALIYGMHVPIFLQVMMMMRTDVKVMGKTVMALVTLWRLSHQNLILLAQSARN